MTKVVVSRKSIDLSKLKLGQFYSDTNGLIKSKITYDSGSTLLIKGDSSCLGYDPCVLSTGKIGLDINLTSAPFVSLVNQLDGTFIAKIYSQPQVWGYKTQPTIMEIEKDFCPSLKYSTLYGNHQGLKLNCNINNVQLFDQDDLTISYKLIKKGYKCAPLLRLNYLCKDDRGFWLDWDIIQLKVAIPAPCFDKCYIDDSDTEHGDNEEEDGEGIVDADEQLKSKDI